MTMWWLWLGLAGAGEGSFDAVVGARTAPDASLEQPSDWEPRAEVTGLLALSGRWLGYGPSGTWFGLQGAAWGLLPEEDSTMLALGPRAGIGGSAGNWTGEIAARYDAQAYPIATDASNGRAEGVLQGALALEPVEIEARVVGIDRHYPFEPLWSFRTVEPGLAVAWFGASGLRLRLGGSWQANQGWTGASFDRTRTTGTQIRAVAEVGLGRPTWEIWAAYHIISAVDGDAEGASRAQFTPVGDYAADADALSAGGFLQHRVDVGGTAELGTWTVRASALARFRDTPDSAAASFTRTVHGHVDLARELGERTSAILTLGASSATLVSDASYLDVYGWAGVSWELGPD